MYAETLLETAKEIPESAAERGLDGLAAEVALPSQFADLWHRRLLSGPVRRLALAVLQLAVLDVLRYASSPRPEERRLYRRARAWIASGERAWPFSFPNVCDALGICGERLRERLLTAVPEERMRAVREVGKLLDTGRV